MRKENGTLTKELDQYDSINGQIIKKFDKEENLVIVYVIIVILIILLILLYPGYECLVKPF